MQTPPTTTQTATPPTPDILPRTKPTRSNFTNNTDPNTLLNKFKHILSNDKIAHLAFLMGYFRASGFKRLWELICPPDNPHKISQFQSIHLLVGLEADQFTCQLNADDIKNEEFKQQFFAQQAQDLNAAEYDISVEQSLAALIAAIADGKLQIRIIKKRQTHAKFYIFTATPTLSPTTQERDYDGRLIVGSSNLSENGLVKNYEFNLESRDSDDIAYAVAEFYALWDEAVPLTSADAPRLANAVKEQSFLKECSVEEIYYKLLTEYFGEARIKIDESLRGYFPRGFAQPDYQLAAISEGLEKLKRYGGFFLSDVVGLGKTLIAAIIAKIYENKNRKTLIICPAALMQNWQHHAELVRLNHRKITSYDRLEKEITQPQDYSLVIIDESHNLARSQSARYKSAQEICATLDRNGERKKVMLLSATPQKNSPADIENQICLFQDKFRANIENITNLETFFSPLKKDFDEIKNQLKEAAQREDTAIRERAKARLKKISQRVVDELLRFVMIRRTRADIVSIEAFAADLAAQGVRFPRIVPPRELTYTLPAPAATLAQNTLALLIGAPNAYGSFGYHRYLIYPNLTELGKFEFRQQYPNQKRDFEKGAQSLQGLIKTLLFKRFESSAAAFKVSLAAQIKSLEVFLKQFDSGEVLIPKNMTNLDKFYDDVLDENDDELENYLAKGKAFRMRVEFFAEDYAEKLRKDLATLQRLQTAWCQTWDEHAHDPKLACLQELLASLIEQNGQKAVIFTEAKTTAEYLQQHLPRHRVISIDAQNRDTLAETIRANFDANFPHEQRDDLDVIIATDTLAEGVNLHRANVIINYDSPWSATKLMQRIGRINRIGTRFDEIFVYNFKPSDFGDGVLGYNAVAYQKLQSFHFMFGEDSAIYDASEEFGSQQIYQIIEAQEKQDPETPFLNDIKKLYNNDLREFERICALKPKSRTFGVGLDASFCYLKNAGGNSYFYKCENGGVGASGTDDADGVGANSNLNVASLSNSNLNVASGANAISASNDPSGANGANGAITNKRDTATFSQSSFLQMAGFLKSHLHAKTRRPSEQELAAHYSEVAGFLEFHERACAPEQTLFGEQSELGSKDPKFKNARIKMQHLPPERAGLDERQIQIITEVLLRGTLAELSKLINAATTQQDYAEIFALCKDKVQCAATAESADTTPIIQLLAAALPTTAPQPHTRAATATTTNQRTTRQKG